MKKAEASCQNSGFSLFELIMVIFIVGVLVAINVPNFLLYNAKTRLNGAARQVVGDLMAARMEAIKQNCNVIVGFEDKYRYFLVIDKDSDNKHDTNETKIMRDLSDRYPGVKNIKTDTKNIFNAKGAMRRMRRIELQNSSGNVNIRVSISGRVKIE